jgi:hypothetical protein
MEGKKIKAAIGRAPKREQELMAAPLDSRRVDRCRIKVGVALQLATEDLPKSRWKWCFTHVVLLSHHGQTQPP